ncbi:MAG: hypothetical protein AAFX54_01245 [Pseudomonadota bacterium]
MRKCLVMIAATAVSLAGCTHDVNVTKKTVGGSPYASIDQRTNVAANTCDAQYKKERQNYLSAVQAVIASGKALPNAASAPLDRFRAEVNAAYNAVVMRCKTHMHCLEFQRYNEAKCYMAAGDRKDAERRFSDLSEDLRRIEREHGAHKRHAKKKKHGKPNVNVTVTQRNDQGQRNDQSQSNDNHNGDRVEDQDVLVLCGDARNLLDRRCRDRCDNC